MAPTAAARQLKQFLAPCNVISWIVDRINIPPSLHICQLLYFCYPVPTKTLYRQESEVIHVRTVVESVQRTTSLMVTVSSLCSSEAN